MRVRLVKIFQSGSPCRTFTRRQSMDRFKSSLYFLESCPIGGIGVIPLKPLGEVFRIERAILDAKQPVARDFEAITVRGAFSRLHRHVCFISSRTACQTSRSPLT